MLTGIAGIARLRKGGIGVVHSIGSSLAWSWNVIFTLHWGKGKLEQLDGAAQAGFALLSMIIDQYQQNEGSI